MRPLLCSLLLVGLLGCSQEAGEPTGEPTSPVGEVAPDALREGLAAAFAGDQPGPEARAEGDCFADRLLRSATVAELEQGGVVGDDGEVATTFPVLERPLAEKVVDAQLACTDFVEDSARAGTYITRGRLVRERYVECVRRDLPDEEIRAAVLAAVMGSWDDPALETLGATQAACAEAARD